MNRTAAIYRPVDRSVLACVGGVALPVPVDEVLPLVEALARALQTPVVARALLAEPEAGDAIEPIESLRERLRWFDGDDACLAGTPMIPIHRDTLRSIRFWLDRPC